MKIRNGFVANSSSSSFIICGMRVPKRHCDIMLGQQFTTEYDGEYIRGVWLGDCCDGIEMPADVFLKNLTEAIEKCKMAGCENPVIFGRYIREY